ncbi:hypothetical protein ACSMEB_20400 [Stenotrophomonas maltophilia]|uniref:hypothetical protein n=1 Tax=Stenotrophomonas maltophilia TaxID=40324 RepID=UPI000B10B685|nr:hypothetical protein [Stenotrophomonas maltophilia]
MIFDSQSIKRLEAMGIDVEEYNKKLLREFSDQASVFQYLIEFMSGAVLGQDNSLFNEFSMINGLCSGSGIHDAAFDLFNYFRLYQDGGRLKLFKCRQAEWNGPIVRLDRSDCPSPRLDILEGKRWIYRGMSIAEFNSKNFGQSWTTDVQVAKRFAAETYEDQRDGVVAVAELNLRNVIYAFLDDPESEVVIARGLIFPVSEISSEQFIESVPSAHVG